MLVRSFIAILTMRAGGAMGKSTSTWPPRVPTGFRPSQRTTARLGRFPNVSVRRQLHAFGLDQLGQRRAGHCVRLPEDEAWPEIDRFRLPAGAGGVDPAAGLPQVLEMTFTIFTNVLDIDENGLVTDTDAAHTDFAIFTAIARAFSALAGRRLGVRHDLVATRSCTTLRTSHAGAAAPRRTRSGAGNC
jgi:hypothetical protein